MTAAEPSPHRAGFVTLVGRPNVGKSTLLNQLVGSTLAAVADKPQTTRNRIVGVLTRPGAQLVFVDTPGIHRARTPLNARLVKTARQALGEGDAAVLVVDAEAGITAADREVAAEAGARRHAIVAVTKSDLVSRSAMIPVCAAAATLIPGVDVVPVSGRTGDNVARLLDLVTATLPEGPPLYPDDQITEQSERMLAAEIVREQVVRQTRNEVPYATAVVVQAFREEPERHLVVIAADVIVERPSQKGIVIGERGARIKEIGSAARAALEACFGCRVFLELHVKLVPGWSKNPRVLGELGI